MDPRITLIGALVGLLVGMSGVGGSSLMAPLLILVVRLNPLVAVGTDLLYSVPTKLLGAYLHWRQGTVDRKILLWLALGGVPGAVLGLGALVLVRAHTNEATLNTIIKHAVGAMLILVAAMMLLTPLLTRLPGRKPRPQMQADVAPRRRQLIVLGALVGFCVSLTSIGSGSLTVPVLYLLAPQLGLRRLIGSNIAFAALLVPISAIGHLGLGDTDLRVSANLLLGSLPGVFVGSRLCAKLPDLWLRPAMAGILVWAGAALV
ncbi:MAG TPA: sulfite exporter TauE/SafE family protein [Chloroflexota bacterium]|jgi:hypothetical protein|nr:sulfite exporter TauE/SafE family protein [Chloroflexota bacterium]